MHYLALPPAKKKYFLKKLEKGGDLVGLVGEMLGGGRGAKGGSRAGKVRERPRGGKREETHHEIFSGSILTEQTGYYFFFLSLSFFLLFLSLPLSLSLSFISFSPFLQPNHWGTKKKGEVHQLSTFETTSCWRCWWGQWW